MDVHGRSVSSLAISNAVLCSVIESFSVKGMNDVTSNTDYAHS